MWADAVFEGGGVKAVALVGALQVAEEKGFGWKQLAGASAGAIIASLLAAGYRAEELAELMIREDFGQFLSKTWVHRIPYLGPASRLLVKKGLYSGRPLEQWIGKLLEKKGVRTFADLKDRKLRIIASDISRGALLVLPKDLEEYGYPAERLTVARAVRMSCSIPYFFDPVKIWYRPSKRVSYIVDGGLLSNFPVWLFDRDRPRWPTFGFRLISETEGQPREIHGPISLFRAMFLTMMEAHDNRHIKEQDRLRTIQVPVSGVGMTDFHISREKRQALYEAGRKAAEAFFDKWKFSDYLAMRLGSSPVRYTMRPAPEVEGDVAEHGG
ncbi:NTE family protein [Planifilum fulgidum]|uniref:NTE family protein n=1 Tax=Planifilum fulgidum TaxID=201973 RepID=A0A1I2SNU8_9BACL|nr:patatin-like phospholipase family protein [Planifilum fulgidum]SFG54444.1 NTE family protein [Planifilum fulgidum]